MRVRLACCSRTSLISSGVRFLRGCAGTSAICTAIARIRIRLARVHWCAVICCQWLLCFSRLAFIRARVMMFLARFTVCPTC